MKLFEAVARETGTYPENIGFIRHRTGMDLTEVEDETFRQPSDSKWDYLKDGEEPIRTLVVIYKERIHSIKAVRGLKREFQNPIQERWPFVKEYDLLDVDSALVGKEITGWANQRVSMLRHRMPSFSRIEIDAPTQDFPDEIDAGVFEGAKSTVTVNRYERSRENREVCIARHGPVCRVCGINFGRRYGEIGKGFIHVHHVVPLSSVDEAYCVDPVKDLVPLCPNCHAMAHRREPPFTVDELRSRLNLDA